MSLGITLTIGMIALFGMARLVQQSRRTVPLATLSPDFRFPPCLWHTRLRHTALVVLWLLLAALAVLHLLVPDRTRDQEPAADIVFIVIDVSRSMGVRDVGSRSRLDAAVSFVREHLLTPGWVDPAVPLGGEPETTTHWGIVLLGARGEAAMLRWPTWDRASLAEPLVRLNPGQVVGEMPTDQSKGTHLGAAVKLVAEWLKTTTSASADRPRTRMLIFSDGGEPDQIISDAWMTQLVADGVSVLAIGLGGDEPKPVPLPDNTPPGFRQRQPRSKREREPLVELARRTGGHYWDFPETVDGRRNLARTLLSWKGPSRPGVDYYFHASRWLTLGLALAVLLAEWADRRVGILVAAPGAGPNDGQSRGMPA